MNPAREARLQIRSGAHRTHTAGLAPGHVQGNLCILPREHAADFKLFCERNPKPCPVLGISAPGDPRLPALGEDLDIRTDVSGYRVFINGEKKNDLEKITDIWREDLVTFVLGCSFS